MRNLRRRQAIAPDQFDKADLAKALSDPENALVVALQFHLKKPICLQQLAQETHFSCQEIRAIYRTFKDASTNAIIHRDIVRQMFGQLFPRGDTEHFADLIFNAFDTDQSGAITFDKFLKGLSVLTRGSLDERLDWIYSLYDPLGSGQISWHRLVYVLTVTEDLLDSRRRRVNSRERADRRERHAQTLFRVVQGIALILGTGTSDIQKFNGGGRLSRESFLAICRRDPTIIESLGNIHFRVF